MVPFTTTDNFALGLDAVFRTNVAFLIDFDRDIQLSDSVFITEIHETKGTKITDSIDPSAKSYFFSFIG